MPIPLRHDLAEAACTFRLMASAGSASGLRWAVLVTVWSLIFAAPHFFWALGGRAGLGAQAAAADAALQQSSFAVYNLAAGCLAILGVAVAMTLAKGWGGRRLRRWLLIAAIAAAVALLLRGVLGVGLLAVSVLRGTFDDEIPAILLAIEPWFLLGGFAYGGMVVHERNRTPSDILSH